MPENQTDYEYLAYLLAGWVPTEDIQNVLQEVTEKISQEAADELEDRFKIHKELHH